jgi:preprotein translocase subunit SecY
MKTFGKLKAYFSNKEIVKRIVYTLFILLIFRVLSKVPAPGIDGDALQNLFGGSQSGFFNIANILAGGTLSQFSIISVGLFAFVNASIIFQLLGPVVPKIDQLQKMGEVGRKIINQWTRVLTVPLAAFQSYGIYLLLKSQSVIGELSLYRIIALIFVLTAGSMLLIWLSELISEHGIGGKQGGGVSVIITSGILASLPASITQAFSQVTTSNFLQNFWMAFGIEWAIFLLLLGVAFIFIKLGKLLLRSRAKSIRTINSLIFIILLSIIPAAVFFILKLDYPWARDIRTLWNTYTARLGETEIRFGFYLALTLQIVGLITFFNESYRKVPIKFISRIRTNTTKGIESISYLPVKLLAPGVMPIIFASSLLLLPQVIYRFFGSYISKKWSGTGDFVKYASDGWLNQFDSPYYYILHFILVVLFSLFFITIVMKPEDIADDLKNRKTFIPGVRPGRETMEYLSNIILRITFWGGLILGLVSVMPFLLGIYNTDVKAGIETFIGGGTSILIAVPTILSIKAQLDALVLTKNYEQFEEI